MKNNSEKNTELSYDERLAAEISDPAMTVEEAVRRVGAARGEAYRDVFDATYPEQTSREAEQELPVAVAAVARRINPADPITVADEQYNNEAAVRVLLRAGVRSATTGPLLRALAQYPADRFADPENHCAYLRALAAGSPPFDADPGAICALLDSQRRRPDVDVAATNAADINLPRNVRLAAWLIAAAGGEATEVPCPPVTPEHADGVAACAAEIAARRPDDALRVVAAIAAASGPEAEQRARLERDVVTVEQLLAPLERERDLAQQERQLSARGVTLVFDHETEKWTASRDGHAVAVPALAGLAGPPATARDQARRQDAQRARAARAAARDRARGIDGPAF